MARTRDLRLWSLAVLAVCLLGAGGGQAGRSAEQVAAGAQQTAVAALSATVDAAVLPARLVDEIRGAAAATPSRVVVLGAVLAALLGLPALVRRTSPDARHGRKPLRTRRHSIALRAPPLRSA